MTGLISEQGDVPLPAGTDPFTFHTSEGVIVTYGSNLRLDRHLTYGMIEAALKGMMEVLIDRHQTAAKKPTNVMGSIVLVRGRSGLKIFLRIRRRRVCGVDSRSRL